MSLETLRALERFLEKQIPGFEIRYKDESKLMQAVGFLVRGFNPEFLRSRATTVQNKVYFPSKKPYESNPDASVRTLAHEFVHLYDWKQAGWAFPVKYTMPQVLAVPFFLVYAVLCSPWPVIGFIAQYIGICFLVKRFERPLVFLSLFVGAVSSTLLWAVFATSGLALILLVAFVCLGPWPSSGRTQWELRAFAMTIGIVFWQTRTSLSDDSISEIARQFTGPNYWYMAGGDDPEFELCISRNRAVKGLLDVEKPYSLLHDFLIEQQRVSGRPA